QTASSIMDHPLYPPATPQMSARRAKLAPETTEAVRNFSKQVFAEGHLDDKTKQLIAVAVAHVTQCPHCIKGHTKLARRKGAPTAEIMEAICAASETRAGAAHAHAALALDALDEMAEMEPPRPAHP